MRRRIFILLLTFFYETRALAARRKTSAISISVFVLRYLKMTLRHFAHPSPNRAILGLLFRALRDDSLGGDTGLHHNGEVAMLHQRIPST